MDDDRAVVMSEAFFVGADRIEVDITRVGDEFRIAKDGVFRVFRVVRSGDGSILVSEAGRQCRAKVQGDDVVIAGRTRRVRRAPPAAVARAPVVTPPMPGVVGRVLVSVGDVVTKGQALVTVTAMKMEVTLRAPHDGTVVVVRVVAGAAVAPGDQLVEVRP